MTDDDRTGSRKRPVARGTSLRRPAQGEPDAKPTVEADPEIEPDHASILDSEAPSDAEAESGAGTESEGDIEPDAPEPVAARPRVRGDRLPFVLVGAAAVIAVAAGVVLGVRPFARVDNEAYVDTARSTEVLAKTKDAAKAIYTIDMNNLAPWESKLDQVMTPAMAADAKVKFRKGVEQVAGALKDVKVDVGDGDLTAGIASLTDAHAEVLVNVQQRVSTQGVPYATQQGPMKFVLDEFDGAWKVSSITPM